MKFLPTSLSVATCLVFAMNVHAQDYYLRCAANGSCPNTKESLRESFKFTRIGDTNEYQLAVEHLCSDFTIGSKDDSDANALHFGTKAVMYLDKATVEGDGVTLALYNSPSSQVISSSDCQWGGTTWYNYWNYLILTLTIDENDSNKATLNIQRITNDNIKDGVPSFIYMASESTTSTDTSKLDPSYRFIKRSSGNYEMTHDRLSGKIFLMAGPCHWGNTDCPIIASGYYGMEIRYVVKDNTPYLGIFGSGGTSEDDYFQIKNDNGDYSFDVTLYQKNNMGGGMHLDPTLYDVDIMLAYDIKNLYSDNKYDDKSKGTLTVEFSDYIDHDFALVTSERGWSTDDNKIYPLEYDGIQTKGNTYYMQYHVTMPAQYKSCFYIYGYNGDDLALNEDVTIFSASADSENIVKNFTFAVGTGAKQTSDVVQFPESGTINTAMVDDSEIPFFVGTENECTILFRYCINDPNASLVAVSTTGTLTGTADIEADDAAAPTEYYNLNGVRVANPCPGLYIVRRGSHVSKQVIK